MSASNMLLNNKKVLVIDGSSGIGRSVAAAALASGASVSIASSTQSKVDAALELLRNNFNEKTSLKVSREAFDIKDFKDLTGFLTKEAPFDHLVITAGEPPKSLCLVADVDIREQLGDSMDARYWAVLNAG
ncbi:short chain dehydrogenase [Ceratobasidium sp. AG-Ba]|nr:short chain dehydrogenase [Ceratobasidium sp. AG-Ba]